MTAILDNNTMKIWQRDSLFQLIVSQIKFISYGPLESGKRRVTKLDHKSKKKDSLPPPKKRCRFKNVFNFG